MLIDKGITANEVITIRTTGGDEVLGKLVEETQDSYVVSKPLLLAANQKGVGLVPMLFTVNPDKDIKIMKSSVMAVAPTDTDFAKQYTQSTTGIALG
jgi:hypothetical protein